MSDHQKHREAMSGKCLEAMSAKGRTFKSLAATIQLSPFITAAALWGTMPLPQDVGLSPKPAKLDFARGQQNCDWRAFDARCHRGVAPRGA